MDVNGVNRVDWLQGRTEPVVNAGLDIGKDSILSVLQWNETDFDRPWRDRNPGDVTRLAELLREAGRNRRLVVAMKPTGTHSVALRQALEQAGLT